MSYEERMLDPFKYGETRVIEEFKTITNHVESLLRRYKSTRNSDKHLIIHYLESVGVILPDRIKKRVIKEIPSFESITRARRKLQRTHPELQADSEIETAREEKQSIVKAWVK